MALTKTISKQLATGLTVALLAVCNEGFSQAETLWRATNQDASSLIPAYQGGANPFPMKQEPVEEQVVEVEDDIFTDEMAASSLQAEQASIILQKLREMISADTIFTPDVSNVVVEGRVRGEMGNRVLISNNWLGKDDSVTVSVQGARKMLVMLDKLEELDKSLASLVSQDIEDRLATARPLRLVIKNITDDSVIFVDDRGLEHSITYSTTGW